MDYNKYVSERIQNPEIARVILDELEEHRTSDPKNLEVSFINNFYDLLPKFSARERLRRMFLYVQKNPETTKFSEVLGWEYASEKLRAQTLGQFIGEIDEVIDSLGVRQKVSVNNLELETVVKIMIDLMARGYKRYPDLAR